MSFFPQSGGPGLTSPRLTSLVNNLLPAPLRDAAKIANDVQDAISNPASAIGKVGDLVGGDVGRTIGTIGDIVRNPGGALGDVLNIGGSGSAPANGGASASNGLPSNGGPPTSGFSTTAGVPATIGTAQPPLVSTGSTGTGFANPSNTATGVNPGAGATGTGFANPSNTANGVNPGAGSTGTGFANPGNTANGVNPGAGSTGTGFANPGNTANGVNPGAGSVLPYSPGGAAGANAGMGSPMGTPANTGFSPGGSPVAPFSPGPGGAAGPGYGGGPSPSPTYPDVGSGLVRRAGPFGNQIGLGTLGDYFYNAGGGDRALNRDELMRALGVSSPIADTLLSTLGDGMTVAVESLIDAFRPYSFDGINISDQGIDMALREAMGPVQANFFSFADPNGNLSMAGFAAIAREAMHFLGMPQPNPAMLSAAFRRMAGIDGMVDISEASAMLGIGPDGSFSLGDAGMAIMNLLSTVPTPGGPAPWGPPIGGPPPYLPRPGHPFGPTMPFAPGPMMGPGQFHAMVNNASRWTGQYFHPAQIDAAYRNIGWSDGSPGVSPWDFGSAFGSMNPDPWQVSSTVGAFSWPSPPFRTW